MKLFTSIVCLFLGASSALAQSEFFSLEKSGDWETSYVTGGYMPYCVANTFNQSDQGFDITIWQDREVKLYIFLDGIPTSERNIDFTLHVDYEVWNFNNAVIKDNMVSFILSEDSKAPDFLTDLAGSKAVALMDPLGNPISTWSLDGSLKALQALLECAHKL